MLKLFLFVFVLTISAVNLHAAEKKRPAGPAVTVTTKQDEVLINARRARLAELSAIEKTAGSRADSLKPLLADKDPLVRGEAAAALGRVKDPGAFSALEAALKSGDEHTRWGAIQGMAELKDPRAVPVLTGVLTHKDRITRWKAAEALGNFSGRAAVDALLLTASDEKEYVYARQAAVNSLVKIGDKRAAAGLKTLKSVKEPGLEKAARSAASALEGKK